MRALVLDAAHQPLVERDIPRPTPGPDQVLIRVRACAVCRTDLHIVEGEVERPKLPLVLGHQVVGTIAAIGASVATSLRVGTAVGVPWLAWTDQTCRYCRRGQENLCPRARFTGYTVDGGYAEYLVADANYCFELPAGYQDASAAPMLCAGLIGFRTWRLAGRDVERLGIYGFGAAGPWSPRWRSITARRSTRLPEAEMLTPRRWPSALAPDGQAGPTTVRPARWTRH